MPPSSFELLFAVFAFVLGAAIGSFLNVCIYRMPRDKKVNDPPRSFCPKCEYQIPWWNNLPLVSWLLLRGKCGNCRQPIPFRYFGVELLTALLFLAVWERVWPQLWVLAFPYWILVSLLVVATFIDFDFFIIPDEITLGGTVAGVILSFAIPILHGTESNLEGGLRGLIGAAAGYLLLRLVVELGKLAFGKRRLSFPEPQPMTWVRKGQDADLKIGADEMLWSDFFARGNERLSMECRTLEVRETKLENVTAAWTLDWLQVGEQKWKLEELDSALGEVTHVVLPREAMGLGDVKFIAAIGAFLGWEAVLFTVVSASMFGAIIGSVALLTGRREWSAKIPFGPYLALGALGWMFFGPALVNWYWAFAFPAPLS